MKNKLQELIAKVDEGQCKTPLELARVCLSKLLEINVGIATLKDEVFFIDGSTIDGDYYVKNTDKGVFQQKIVKQ